MNDLHRVILLVSMGTLALLLCLPSRTDAQPVGKFDFDFNDEPEAGFEGWGWKPPPLLMTRQRVLERLADMAMSRSNNGPGYTIPRKRQAGGVGIRFFPIDRVSLDDQLRTERDVLANIERNLRDFDAAGRRR